MDSLTAGRDFFAQRAWADCHAALSAADRQSPLEVDDLERAGVAAYLIGREAESIEAFTRAYQLLTAADDIERAARCAFWMAFQLFNAGNEARGGAWLARAQRLLEETGRDCVEQGYVLVPSALQCLGSGDLGNASALFDRAVEIGERFHDPTLTALARLGKGQATLGLGEARRAAAMLDEVMVAVTSGEVSPVVTGIVYCAVIMTCQESFDVRRAGEWTAALSQWCASQPDLVPYRGQCLVHRAELMQLRGAWADAMDEAEHARQWLSEPPPGKPAVGMAYYVQGELHRLRGEFGAAEDAYREANHWGRQPQPGLALLRLAQGRVDAAAAGIKRTIDEAHGWIARARMLPAFVEIMLAADDLAAARVAADELAGIAADVDLPYLRAMSAHASGAVLLAEGNCAAAMDQLRRAWSGWQQVDAPYDAGRVRVLIGLACRRLGDEDACEMELDAARWVFQQLGAAPDLARVEALAGKVTIEPACGLTAREVEVLALVATGRTNRAISSELVISEKTVARHVSNIFTKLGLSSRSAATAYAYEHGLVRDAGESTHSG
jgi:ATP/maltotriose-dependent transcriptional regulator MalT